MNPTVNLTRRDKSEISNPTTFNKSFYLASCTKYMLEVMTLEAATRGVP